MRFTKQESLASTRNALRAAREAEETARGTLGRLGDQTERLANVDRSLDMAKAYNERSQDEAKEIAALNRSIFRPTFTWNKEKKRNAEEERIMRRHIEEQERREDNRRMRAESSRNVEGNLRQAEKKPSRWGGSSKAAQYGEANAQQSKMATRARYQFEADAEDDALEDELDNNLDEIGDMSKRLNLLARAAGDEVRQQNNTLGGLNDKTDKYAYLLPAAQTFRHNTKCFYTVSTSKSSAPHRGCSVSSEHLFSLFPRLASSVFPFFMHSASRAYKVT